METRDTFVNACVVMIMAFYATVALAVVATPFIVVGGLLSPWMQPLAEDFKYEIAHVNLQNPASHMTTRAGSFSAMTGRLEVKDLPAGLELKIRYDISQGNLTADEWVTIHSGKSISLAELDLNTINIGGVVKETLAAKLPNVKTEGSSTYTRISTSHSVW